MRHHPTNTIMFLVLLSYTHVMGQQRIAMDTQQLKCLPAKRTVSSMPVHIKRIYRPTGGTVFT